MRPTVALFRDFAVRVVAPQGKTTVSFRSPVPVARGFFCLEKTFLRSNVGTNITPIEKFWSCPLYPQVALWDTSAASLNPELEFIDPA